MSRTQPVADIVTADLFKARVHAWAERIGVEVKQIHLRDMKRKLASASTTGRLTFDSCVPLLPIDKRDEVIVHELVHLRVGNHGPLFRSLVSGHLQTGPP